MVEKESNPRIKIGDDEYELNRRGFIKTTGVIGAGAALGVGAVSPFVQQDVEASEVRRFVVLDPTEEEDYIQTADGMISKLFLDVVGLDIEYWNFGSDLDDTVFYVELEAKLEEWDDSEFFTVMEDTADVEGIPEDFLDDAALVDEDPVNIIDNEDLEYQNEEMESELFFTEDGEREEYEIVLRLTVWALDEDEEEIDTIAEDSVEEILTLRVENLDGRVAVEATVESEAEAENEPLFQYVIETVDEDGEPVNTNVEVIRNFIDEDGEEDEEEVGESNDEEFHSFLLENTNDDEDEDYEAIIEEVDGSEEETITFDIDGEDDSRVVEIGEGSSAEEFELTVNVEDADTEEGLEDAGVEVDGDTEVGEEVTFDLEDGTYTVTADNDGYEEDSESIEIDGEDKEITISLEEEEAEEFELTVNVEDADTEEGLEDAEVEVDGDTEVGEEVTFDLEDGTYTVTADNDGYEEDSESIEIDGEDKEITISLEEE